MRIGIEPSAPGSPDHLITDAEIRNLVGYPVLRIKIQARRDNADPTLYMGRSSDNQAHIEVAADLIDPTEAVVFHAMMLRPGLIRQLSLDLFITPEFAPQRA